MRLPAIAHSTAIAVRTHSALPCAQMVSILAVLALGAPDLGKPTLFEAALHGHMKATHDAPLAATPTISLPVNVDEVDHQALALLDVPSELSVSRVTRRRLQINVSPGDNLQTAVDNAQPGDELILADGNYTAEAGDNMLLVNKNITIRAQNPGQAVLDGQDARRVMYILSGAVTLDGLNITHGKHSEDWRRHRVTARILNALSLTCFVWLACALTCHLLMVASGLIRTRE